MQLIDTHTHLYLDDFKEDIGEVIGKAEKYGVTDFFLPNIDSEVIEKMLVMETRFPNCHAMMGLHPCSVKENNIEEVAIMENWLSKRKFAAIGETGLDFHWDTSFAQQQIESFKMQMEWAKSLDIPVVIHSRKSTAKCLELVAASQDGRLTGVFHCFSGSLDEAKMVVDLGFHIGIGGVVTYKNGGLDPVIKNLGLQHVVLETDAPYLSPVPFRGKRNEPSYLQHIVEKLSELATCSNAEVAAITTRNAKQLYRSSFQSDSAK